MITVAYTDVSHELSGDQIFIWLNELPANKKASVGRSLERGNGRATLIGLQLLRQAASDGNKQDIRAADIHFESGKKPVFDNGPDFSISHSGNIVVCAVAHQGHVGIDVEK